MILLDPPQRKSKQRFFWVKICLCTKLSGLSRYIYYFLNFSSIFRRKIELSKIFFHTFPGLGTNFSGLSLAELRSANERPEKLVPRSGKNIFPRLGAENFFFRS